jgi:hypothetical protein
VSTVTSDPTVAVVAIKSTGTRVLFGRYPTRAAADQTIRVLRGFGLEAEVDEGVAPHVRPGEAARR